MITQVLKFLSVKAFSVWRRFEQSDLANISARFKSLERYQYALNKVQLTSGLMVDASLELPSHAKAIH